MLEAQRKRFLKTSKCVIIMQLLTYFILFSAVYLYLKNSTKHPVEFMLICSKEGWEWEVLNDNATAGFFILFHMIIIGAPIG